MRHDAPPPPAARAAGFTLIEIMVVVAILGLLATLVVTNVTLHADEARVVKARTDVRMIGDAVRLYYTRHGRLPALGDLTAADAQGHRALDVLPQDPWQNDYVVRPGDAPREFTVASAGPDRQIDTADDVSSRSAP